MSANELAARGQVAELARQRARDERRMFQPDSLIVHRQEDLEPEIFDLGDDGEDDQEEADPLIEKQLKKVEEKALEEGRIIEPIRKVKLIKKLPEHLKFKEDHPAYKIVPSIIHERYSGRDGAQFSKDTNKQTGKKNQMPCSVSTIVYPEDSRPQITVHNTAFDKKLDNRWLLRTWLNDHTQYPSVSVSISTGDKKPNIEARIFGSRLDRQGSIGLKSFEMNTGFDVNQAYTPSDSPELLDRSKKGKLMQKILRVDRGGKAVKWAGLSRSEIQRVRDKVFNNQPCDAWERAVAHIDRAHEIAIHHYPRNEEVEVTKKTCEYFTALMETAKEHGDFWFFSLTDPMTSLPARQFKFQGPESSPPRWLITHWWPVWHNGQIIEAIPVKWGGFPDCNVWPSPTISNSAWRMSLGRTRDTKTRTLANALEKQASIMLAQFKQSHADPGAFKVDVFASLSSPSVNMDDMRPEPGTTIELRIVKDGKFVPNRYKGVVVPNMWKGNATFTMYVQGNPDVTLHKTTQRASITVTSSDVAITRQENAMRLSLGHLDYEQREGPDIGYLAFSNEPQSGTTNLWLKNLQALQKQAFIDLCKNRNLNEEQMHFVHHFLQDESGISTLVGPPGTGKSEVLNAVIRAYVLTNKLYRPKEKTKVMVAAPANYAVDELCLRFIQFSEGINVVRFVGGTQSRAKPQAGDKVTIDSEENKGMAENLEAGFYEMADDWVHSRKVSDKLADWYSDAQFTTWVLKFIATTKDNNLKNTAVKWKDAYNALRSKELSGKARSYARDAKKEMEDVLLPLFYDQVDIVFVTLNSAAHDKLRPYFKVDLAVIDEIGMAAIPDLMTLIAPNLGFMKHMVLAGDTAQQRPMLLARSQNEFGRLHELSVLEKIKRGDFKERGIDYVELKVQYRAIPEIANMWAYLSYRKDGLKNADSTFQPKPLMSTFKKLFRGLGDKIYKDWACFGVAVSGPETYSRKWYNTTSQVNIKEANAVIQTIQALINEEPAAGGVRVMLKDILVLSPYQGQANHIASMAAVQGWMRQPENRIRVECTGKIHGNSAPIVLLSLCKNKPADPTSVKFVADPHMLNVAISRAESGLIIFGNFVPWVEALRFDSEYFRNKGKAIFGDLVKYLHRRIVSAQDMEALLKVVEEAEVM
ncbi:hypothetical protein KCU93_g3836, partial [Aureobasidium melanogenum]